MNKKHSIDIENHLHAKGLFFVLLCLTILFIVAQLSFVFIHYKVSDLVDSLASSPLLHALRYPIMYLPIIQFMVIQLLGYLLFVGWIWFIACSLGELFQLSTTMTHGLGIACWMLGVIAILLLNNYYFSHSFFAKPFHHYAWLEQATTTVLEMVLIILAGVAILAYINYFWFGRHRVVGSLFLLLGCCAAALNVYDIGSVVAYSPQQKPNIILIGVDSVRPDFTGFTPNIDSFLQKSSVFTHAYTPLARTFPAWISILTAKYPKHNHARVNLANSASIIANDNLAKKLKTQGYEAVYATDMPRYTDITPEYGFDRVLGPKGGAVEFLIAGLGDFPLTNLLVNFPGVRFLFPYHYGSRAADITYEPDAFLQLVRDGLAHRANKPLFLAIHLCLAHSPYTWAQDGQSNRLLLPKKYQNSLAAVDNQLDKLLQILKNSGLLEHSLVVLLSDHGTTVGLRGDRLIAKEKYLGKKDKLRFVTTYKLSSAPEYSLDFKRDYTISTSYGQGTDILSLKQYQVLLGFRGYGVDVPAQRLNMLASLLDVTPTILEFLQMDPIKQADGVSLKRYLFHEANTKPVPRSLFLETADKVAQMETDEIAVGGVVKQMIGSYQIDRQGGLLFFDSNAEKLVNFSKQRAVLWGDWLLALYPFQSRSKLAFDLSSSTHPLSLQPYFIKPYYVLVNVRSGYWTMDLSSDFSKTAPLKELTRLLANFYGREVAIN